MNCFNSYKEAITYQMNKDIETNKKYDNKINNEILKYLNIVEYKNTRLGMNQNKFIEMILNSKVVIETIHLLIKRGIYEKER